ncbi:leucyl aminopeptidase family protein, partial [Rhizobium brockwellii]
MAPDQIIERPTPFNTKGGSTLPIIAVTPAHNDTRTIDPIALNRARRAGYK